MATLKVPTIFTAIDKFSSVVLGMSKNANSFATKTQAAFARVERSARTFTNGVESVKNKIFNLHNTIGVLFAGMALRKGFEIVTNAAETADEIDKISGVIGISKKSFQELSFAAKRENVSNELLTGSFLKMNKAVGQLQQGSGNLKSFLEKNNPALLKQLKTTKSSEEAFNLLSGAVEKAPNQMQKAAIAAAAFGKGGIEMIKLIEIGPAGIQKLRDEAQKLGIVMSDSMIADAANFADAQDNMNAALTGLKVTIASGLLPIMEKGIEKLTNWIVQNKDLIKAKTAEFFQKIADAGKWLYDNWDTIVSVGTKVIKALALIWIVSTLLEAGMLALSIISGTITAVIWLYEAAVTAAGIAQAVFNAIMYVGILPIIAIVAAIGILIAIIYLVVKHTKGWGEQWDEITRFMGAVFDVFRYGLYVAFLGIKNGFLSMVDAIVLAWEWGQNKIGNLSDAQFKRNKEQIKLEQAARVAAVTDAANKAGAAAKVVAQGMEFKLAWKTQEDLAAEDAANNPKPIVNTRKTAQDAVIEKTQTNNQNKNVMIDFKNMPKGVETSGNGLSFLTPKTTSTLGF